MEWIHGGGCSACMQCCLGDGIYEPLERLDAFDHALYDLLSHLAEMK